MKWFGNRGRLTPEPGTVRVVRCDTCHAQMSVERNVNGPTSYAESMAGRKHRHDFFQCPNYHETWHERAQELLSEGANTKSTKIRKLLADEIAEIIATKKIPD